MLSHSSIWDAIDRLAERYDLTASGMARRAGLDPTTFNRSKRIAVDGRPRWPSTESIAKILAATGSTMSAFLALGIETAAPPVRTLPMIGFAQAGAGGFFEDASFPPGVGWDEIAFPGDEAGATYALQVAGDSMLPLYRDRDVIIVSRTATPRPGDRVVVRTREGEVMAKVLRKRTARTMELESLNPEHAARTFKSSEIEWIARILWASQ